MPKRRLSNSEFMKKLISILFFLSLLHLNADEKVTATGRAATDRGSAKEIALTDALRDAVRQGAGVDLVSSTKVKDFIMEYDKVFTSSFGYVRDYKIISTETDKDGLLTVKIEATVGKGMPEAEASMALRQIVRQKGSPRLLIECNGSIEGIDESVPLISSQLKELALKYGIEVVNAGRAGKSAETRAKRDELNGDNKSAQFRRSGISSNSDFVITASVNGKFEGAESLYGVQTNKYSFGADLDATWTDSGEIIAQVAIPSVNINSSVSSKEQAARDCLMRIFEGKIPQSREKNALTLFSRIIAAWITELDMGAKIVLEFKTLDTKSFDKIVSSLNNIEGVTAVHPREVDPKHISTIEVESRLNATQLKDEVTKITGGKFKMDKLTKNYVQFEPGGKESIEEARVTASKTASRETESGQLPAVKTESRSNLSIWLMLGGVAIFVFGIVTVALLFILLRKKK
jgi:hypothetical protein